MLSRARAQPRRRRRARGSRAPARGRRPAVKSAARVDGRDQHVELGALGFAGDDQPDRVEQRLALWRRCRRPPAWPAPGTRRVEVSRGAPASASAQARDHRRRRAAATPRRGRRHAPAPSAASNAKTSVHAARAARSAGRPTRPAAGARRASQARAAADGAPVAIPRASRYGSASVTSRAGVGGLQVVAVDPRQLGLVEHARRCGRRRQVEPPRQLVERQHLVAVAGRPADQRQVVGQRLRQVALGAGTRPPRSRRGASTAARDRAPAPATGARTPAASSRTPRRPGSGAACSRCGPRRARRA